MLAERVGARPETSVRAIAEAQTPQGRQEGGDSTIDWRGLPSRKGRKRGDELRGSVELKPVLIDTGSASTVLSADVVEAVGITSQPDDVIDKLRGIGGTEVEPNRLNRHIPRAALTHEW